MKTSQDVKDLMCAMMEDVLLKRIDRDTGVAACRMGDVAIRTFELERKYGTNGHRNLMIASPRLK